VKRAAWVDPVRWAGLCDGTLCPICTEGPLGVLAEFDATWLTADEEGQLPGYACVVSKVHAVEPFELRPDASVGFWAEAMAVARALSEIYSPVKINYGIHGNVIPHLHMHLWPRHTDDPYDVGGIPAGVASFKRAPAELERMAVAAKEWVPRFTARFANLS
jgi:diadenosine tetraphosphate (Ap4A) HIT family hydrolase